MTNLRPISDNKVLNLARLLLTRKVENKVGFYKAFRWRYGYEKFTYLLHLYEIEHGRFKIYCHICGSKPSFNLVNQYLLNIPPNLFIGFEEFKNDSV